MNTPQRLRPIKGIENEVYQKIKIGIPEGTQKKYIVQDIVREVFLARFPREGNLATAGVKLAKQIFNGGFAAAEELNWKVEKAVKHLARGLLMGIREHRGDFFTAASVVVYSAILCARRTPADLGKVTERVIGVVLKAGREKECNMDELTKRISRIAIEAAGSFPDENLAPIERMLLGLLDGQVTIDEESIHWQ